MFASFVWTFGDLIALIGGCLVLLAVLVIAIVRLISGSGERILRLGMKDEDEKEEGDNDTRAED